MNTYTNKRVEDLTNKEVLKIFSRKVLNLIKKQRRRMGGYGTIWS